MTCPPEREEQRAVSFSNTTTVHNSRGGTMHLVFYYYLVVMATIGVTGAGASGSCLTECAQLCPTACQYYRFTDRYELDLTCDYDSRVTNDLVSRWLGGCQSQLTRLNTVYMHRVDVDRIPSTLGLFPKIRLLNLTGNRISDLGNGGPPTTTTLFAKLDKLETLALDVNAIRVLFEGSFVNMRALRALTLTHNQIDTIHQRAFIGTFTQLRLIDLRWNRLKQLDSWPLFFFDNIYGPSLSQDPPQQSRRLRLRLDNNLIARLTNRRAWVWTDERIRQVRLTISLADNQLQSINQSLTAWDIRPKWARAMLAYRPVYVDSLQRNPVRCDCHEYYWIRYRTILEALVQLDGLRCFTPVGNFHSRQLSNVPANELYCRVNCTTKARGGIQCRQYPANQTLQITRPNSANARLSFVWPPDLPPLPAPRYKYVLDFSGRPLGRRSLDSLPEDFHRVGLLNLSGTGIAETDDRIVERLIAGADQIDLRGNNLSLLPQRLLKVNFSPGAHHKMFLSGNPWSCDCNSSWLITWFQESSRDLIGDLKELRCATPLERAGQVVYRIRVDDLCKVVQRQTQPTTHRDRNEEKRGAEWASSVPIFPILASLVGALVVLCIGLFLCYCARIRVWKTCHLHPFDRDECSGEAKVHDVYLHFHPADAPWVLGVLSEKLISRQRPYDISMRALQQLIGVQSAASMSMSEADSLDLLPSYVDLNHALENSKRVIVVLSPLFAQDDDLLAQLIAILRHPHPRTPARTLLIRLSQNCRLTPAVEKLIAKRRVHQLNHGPNRPNFWKRLFYWLPVNPVRPLLLQPIDRGAPAPPEMTTARTIKSAASLPRFQRHSSTLLSSHRHPLLRSASAINWSNNAPRSAASVDSLSTDNCNSVRPSTEATFV